MYCGVDIGGTHTQIGAVDASGRVIDHEKLNTASFTQARDLVVTIAYTILRMAKVSGNKVEGIGVGCPNVNPKTGMLRRAANLNFKDEISLRDELAQYFPGIPVVVDNDANAAAMGERIYGKAQHTDDFLCVTLGTGVGGGVFCNGKLVYGLNGMAGEIGHMMVETGGRPCGCGRKGCLERYASAGGILQNYLEICTEKNIAPKVAEYRQLAEAAKAGDLLALQAFDKAARILGRALADIACVTAPTHIFVFGGVAQVGEILLAPLRRHFAENLLFCYKDDRKQEADGIRETEHAQKADGNSDYPAAQTKTAGETPAVCIELSALMETMKDAAVLGAAALARFTAPDSIR